MVSNKRKYTRYNKRLQTSYTDGTEHFTGFSADISEQGLFIAARRILSPGTELSMRLTLPDGSHAGARGIVRRAIKGMSQISRGGMGVELVSYDDNFYEFLKSVIKDFKGTDLTNASGSYYKPPAGENPAPSVSPDAAPGAGASSASSSGWTEAAPSNPSPASSTGAAQQEVESRILTCAKCGAKNKVPLSKIALGPKCGRCKSGLVDDAKPEPRPADSSSNMNSAPRPEAGSAKPETDFEAVREEFTTIACAACGAKNKVPVSKMVLSPKCGRCRESLF